jgi:hypothetical protein
LAAFAKLCGGTGFKVESAHQLKDTLKEALTKYALVYKYPHYAPIFPGSLIKHKRKITYRKEVNGFELN